MSTNMTSFENSVHCPCFEEAQKFDKLMVEKVLAENINSAVHMSQQTVSSDTEKPSLR